MFSPTFLNKQKLKHGFRLLSLASYSHERMAMIIKDKGYYGKMN